MSHKSSPKPYSIAVASDAIIMKRDKDKEKEYWKATKTERMGNRQL